MLDIRVLGTIEADLDERPVDLGRRGQRAVLGVLVAARGEVVSTDRLIEELWRGRPPARAIVSVQAYVSNLRRALEPARVSRGPATTLVRRSSGYALAVPEDAVDAWRFERSLARARTLAPDQARPVLTEILRWWRGPMFGESRDEPWAVPEATRLDELRLSAQEQAIKAALRIGEHTDALLEAQHLARENPLRTEACRLLALALWAGGREPDALEALRRHRDAIGDELGLDPAPVLTELERAVLDHRREVLEAETGADRPRPAQLPMRLTAFTGRDVELDDLTAQARASATMVATITGMGGVGKTALAVRWGHEHQASYPDGQLYLDLRGFDPAGEPLPVAEALRSLLTALGAPADALPESVPDRAALLRSLLTGRRMLVILDNARDDAQVRDLIPGATGSAVLITSRVLLNDLVATHHAHPISLAPFTEADAGDFLTRRIGAARIAAEPDAARAIVAVSGGLPLALAVVAARIVTNPSFPLTAIAGQLRGEDGLDAFAAPGVSRDPRTVFSWSYRQLPEAAAELFRRLALHPGPDVTIAATASLTATTPAAARAAMSRLVEAHLIREHQPGRFRFHDLLRAYATELAEARDDDATRALVVRRSLDHYLHSAMTATAVLLPQRKPITPLPAAPGVTPESPRDAGPLAWFDAEYPNLLAALGVAEQRGDGPYCWQFNWVIAHYVQDLRRRLDDAVTHLQRAVALAEEQQDDWWIASLAVNLGRCWFRLDRREESRACFERVIVLGRKLGDDFRLTQGLLGVAAAINGEGRVPDAEQAAEARPYAVEALEISKNLPSEMSRLLNEAVALGNIAWHELHQPDGYQAAARDFTTAIDLLRKIGYRVGQASMLVEFGHLNRHAGAVDAAIEAYRAALELATDVHDLQAEAMTGLACCYRELGDREMVEELRHTVLALLAGRHHPSTIRIRATLETCVV